MHIMKISIFLVIISDLNWLCSLLRCLLARCLRELRVYTQLIQLYNYQWKERKSLEMEHLSELVKIIAVVIYDERHTNIGVEFRVQVIRSLYPFSSSKQCPPPDFTCASIIISLAYYGILSYNMYTEFLNHWSTWIRHRTQISRIFVIWTSN